jgi:hypothetical protein
VKASRPVGVGTRPKIQDLKKFQEFVAENCDKTKKLMAQLWGNEDPQQNISYGKQVGITRKKQPRAIKKEMNKKEYNFEKS